MLYFSAQWCGACRAFTPVLARFYEQHRVAKNFEVVFISWDEFREEFAQYHGKMPWPALEFDQRETVDRLASRFDVQVLPTLVAINGDTGALICRNARQRVTEDPEATMFPWPDPRL